MSSFPSHSQESFITAFSKLTTDRPNPRVGADHGVDFDWSRQSRDCPDVSAKILNSDYSAQHCSMYREL